LIFRFLAVLALSTPLFAHATSIDASCGQTVKAFFAPLVQQHLIRTKPFRIGPGSVNHFEPRLLKSMDFYGLPVVEVFGYTNEPLLFIQQGPAEQDVYGVVVRESIANVQAQLNSMSAYGARTIRLDAQKTIIMCKGEAA
jgi:hypothetical protein